MDIAEVGLKIIQVASSAGGVWALTQVVKVAPSIPWIKEGQKTRVRAVAGVLSAVAVVLWGAADQGLSVDSLQGLVNSVGTLLAVWGGAHVTSKLAS